MDDRAGRWLSGAYCSSVSETYFPGDLMALASEGISIYTHTLHPRHTHQNINLQKKNGEGKDQHLRVYT